MDAHRSLVSRGAADYVNWNGPGHVASYMRSLATQCAKLWSMLSHTQGTFSYYGDENHITKLRPHSRRNILDAQIRLKQVTLYNILCLHLGHD